MCLLIITKSESNCLQLTIGKKIIISKPNQNSSQETPTGYTIFTILGFVFLQVSVFVDLCFHRFMFSQVCVFIDSCFHMFLFLVFVFPLFAFTFSCVSIYVRNVYIGGGGMWVVGVGGWWFGFPGFGVKPKNICFEKLGVMVGVFRL